MKRREFLLCGIAALVGSVFTGGKVLAYTKGENVIMNANGAKILVAYYSYSGNTRQVANAIHNKVGGDIFKIKTEGSYPADYNAMITQAKKEIQNGYRPKLTTSIADIDKYDIVFLGSPNWWGTITPQVSSFLEQYNVSGKTVIPFITHGSGGFQNTVYDMTAQCKGCKIAENPWEGYGNTTEGLSDWLEKIGF